MNTMTTAEAKAIYTEQAAIYNCNMVYLRRQANKQEIENLLLQYNCQDDKHLAKKLMLRGIQLN
jgi:hypothetical protein